MRTLTFRGFLAEYVKDLSGSGTLDLRKLAAEAAANPRLRAPLALYAVAAGKAAYLMGCLPESEYGNELRETLRSLQGSEPERLLESRQAPAECQKAWDSFLVRKAAPGRDRELKEAMRKKLLRLAEEGRFDVRTACGDLGLNRRNVDRWLLRGDGSRVGLQTAGRIISHAARHPGPGSGTDTD